MASEVQDRTKYNLDDQVGYLLRLAVQRHSAIFQTRIAAGLTPTQFATMIRLSEHGRCSQNQLGRYAAVDIATIKGVVDRLRQKGLVKAETSQDDKRRSLISLTAQGEKLIGDLYRDGTRITEETLAPLTPAEAETFVALLRKMA